MRIGVWIDKRNYATPAMLSLANASLNELREEDGAIVVGANTTLADFETFWYDITPAPHPIRAARPSAALRSPES